MIIKSNKFDVQLNLEQFGKIEISEVCELTGLRYITFYANFRKDNIEHERRGKKILFVKKDILDYMEKHKVGNWSEVTEDIIEDEKIDMYEACNMADVCYDTLYGIMRRNNFPRFQYGTKIVFCKSWFQKYLDSCKQKTWVKQC